MGNTTCYTSYTESIMKKGLGHDPLSASIVNGGWSGNFNPLDGVLTSRFAVFKEKVVVPPKGFDLEAECRAAISRLHVSIEANVRYELLQMKKKFSLIEVKTQEQLWSLVPSTRPSDFLWDSTRWKCMEMDLQPILMIGQGGAGVPGNSYFAHGAGGAGGAHLRP